MANPLGGIARRLFKWLLKHGQDELQKEIDKHLATSPRAQVRASDRLPEYPPGPPF